MLPQVPLGRLLLESGILTQGALDEVLLAQRGEKEKKKRLGELLVARGLVRPQQLAQLLSHQLSCPWISLEKVDIQPWILGLLPRDVALAHAVVPVHVRVGGKGSVLYVAIDDPTDEVAISACARAAAMTVRPMVALTSDIKGALRTFYGGPEPTIPPPRASVPAPRGPAPSAESDVAPVEEEDVIAIVESTRREEAPPGVLVLAAPPRFLEQCREATAAVGATLTTGGLVEASDLVTAHRPCAIVVTEDVYAFDRSRLSHLALDNDAVLVVWTEDVEGKQLELLLKGAVKRWRRASYDKDATVDGRYELLRDLGGAVGGSLWEVRHTRTGRRSVLKIGVRTQDANETERVQREQAALARVDHPGVVELRDAATTELGDPYIVLEPLDGRTLEGLVAARGRLLAADAVAILLGVARSLAAAHAAGVYHGDLRPEHIVVIRDERGVERTKLTGWESARVLDATESGASAARAADIRGVASCAFEALVGRAPSPGEAIEILEAPGALSDALARALTSDSGATFGSMGELADALADAVPAAYDGSHVLEASRLERGRASIRPASPGPEQRRATRAAYRTPVRIAVPGVGAVDGRSEDVSAGGLMVVTRAAITAGSDVTIRFALPLDGRIIAEGAVVRWSRAAHGDDAASLWAVGVELTAPAPETIRQIEKYVAFMGDGATEKS